MQEVHPALYTIDDLTPRYEQHLRHERRAAQATVVAYLSDLGDLGYTFRKKPAAEISTNDLAAYVMRLSQLGYHSSTIRRKFGGFSTFWRWMMRNGYATANVPDTIDMPRLDTRVPKWMSVPELVKFVTTKPARRFKLEANRDLLLYKTIAWLGLRRSEALNLRVDDVRLTERIVVIRQTKNGQDRLLPLADRLAAELTEYMKDRRDGFMFTSLHGGKLDYRRFTTHFTIHLVTCGLAGLGYTPHTLRHTFASHLVMAGVDLVTVSKLLGHRDLRSTMIYVHVSQLHLKEAMNKHPLNEVIR